MKNKKYGTYARDIFVRIKIMKKKIKVRDHCYYNGKFRGAAPIFAIKIQST